MSEVAPAPPLPAGVVTFVMTDIEGSTRLFREQGERYVELLATHYALLRGPFTDRGGVEVGTEGDALFFVFDDAAEAVAACLEGQRALAAHAWPPDAEVRVRIGLHTAEAVPVGRDYVDLAVHQVARISAGAHGGQVLLSEATADAVEGRLPDGATLVPLGSFQLRGFPDPQRLFQLGHPDLRERFPPLRLIGVVVHNLPFLRASFVGRTQERAALASLLSTEGVVSVVGLGGVGKTRLAIQVAFDALDRFPDGAWLVELAAVADPASVPRAIAEAARVAEQPGRSIDDVLVEALADKVVLLVLDSCERLLDAVAAIAERLSRSCPHLVILATSREPLDIQGEVVWRVSPLAVVDAERVVGLAEIASADAVRLFVERARSIDPRFELTDDNATDVARIVAQVNGIPLAIELAAAALDDRPLSGVLSGLSDRFSLLTRGRRTAPPRHQTLRAALEWSLDLLPSDERQLFARLAAFAGGGTTEAIADVCGDLPGAGEDVPRILRHLARASLLVPHPELPDRWSMLESVRQLAAIELQAVGEDDEMAVRHRTWFALRVERTEGDIGRAGRPGVMEDLIADLDNVRRAIDTAMAAGDRAAALRICTAMAPFWTSHGDWTEGCERLRAAVELPGDGDPHLRGRSLVALGNLLLLRGDLAEAEAGFSEGRRIAIETSDDVVLARALAGEGYMAFRGSRLDEAQTMWEEALERAERAGDERVAAGILRSLAIAAGSSGLQDRAADLLDRAITLARRTGDDQQLRLLLGSAAEMHLWLGDYEAADKAYGDALALASTIGDLSARPLLLAELGWVALLRGAVATAERLSIQAAELAEDLGSRRAWAHALRLQGEALLRRGEPDAAAAALDRALGVAEELGAPAEVAGVRCSQACVALEQEQPEEAHRLVDAATALSALPHPMRRVSLAWVRGAAALTQGDLDAAERAFSTDLDVAEAGGIVRHQANALWGLGRVGANAEGVSPATELHQRALALRHRIGDRLGVVDSLVGLAMAGAPSEPEEAARLVGAAVALRARAGATPTPREAAEVAAASAAIGAHSDPRLQEALREGGDLDEDAAVAVATRLGAATPATGRAIGRRHAGSRRLEGRRHEYMGWLDGDVALITGAGSGLGRALVDRFVAEGARVVAFDRAPDRLAAVEAANDGAVAGVVGDVTVAGDNERAVALALERFGRLDTFIGNAGMFDYGAGIVDTPIEALDRAFDELFALNVKACLLGVKAAVAALTESGGSVLLTASMSSTHAGVGGVVYTASKHAVVGLVRQMAYELAPRVRVNGVAPGFMRTDIRGPASLGLGETTPSSVPGLEQLASAVVPLGFLPSPEDYTGHYVQLASRANAAATTGIVVACDGGLDVRGLGLPSGGDSR